MNNMTGMGLSNVLPPMHFHMFLLEIKVQRTCTINACTCKVQLKGKYTMYTFIIATQLSGTHRTHEVVSV